MLSDNELKQLAQASEVVLPTSDLISGEIAQPENEKDLMLSLAEPLARDGVAMNFFAAGAYDFYQPVANGYTGQGSCLDWYHLQGDVVSIYQDIQKDVELSLAQLFSMQRALIMDTEPVTVLSDLLTRLYSLQTGVNGKRRKVILPSSMPPVFRHALCTRLKYHSLETIVIDFDKNSGCVTMAQLDSPGDDVLAIAFSYPNFFGVIEDVALITAWAQAREINTVVVADTLALTHIQSPSQVCEQLDYIVADLQPLGFPLSRKGNAPALLAGSEVQLEKIDAQGKQFTLFDDLVKMWNFLHGQSAQQLQQAHMQAQTNLKILLRGLTEIENISLRFSGFSLNECVIQIDQIDLTRALQILAGHNMLAGYPLVDDYPELDGCLLIHCTDQHKSTEIERFIQKMATVVKNLSTAGCPVKPKFT
jgi:glycine dehydrogenase subunit 1